MDRRGPAAFRLERCPKTLPAARVRIDQDLIPIEAVAGAGLVRAVHAVPVQEPGSCLRQVDVPDEIRAFFDPNPVRLLRVVWSVEEAEVHCCCIFGKQGEVHSLAVPGCS